MPTTTTTPESAAPAPIPATTSGRPTGAPAPDPLRLAQRRRFYAQWVRPNVGNGACFALLPTHQVSLMAYEPGGERFARLFRETWKRIPLHARRRMLRFWKRHARGDYGDRTVAHSPLIELLEPGPGERSDYLGWTGGFGHRLRFKVGVVGEMPDELVRDLIAHELAHVDRYADGFEFEELWECEMDADRTTEMWGFSADAIDAWSSATGRVRVIDWDNLSEAQKQIERARAESVGRGIALWL